MAWTPDAISRFLERNLYKMDGPGQWSGDEPNVVPRDWDSARVRMLLAASWPYEQAAGNQSVPAVAKAVSSHAGYLCDRYYLPATPRDMRAFERESVPVFGLEHRRPLADYDVVGTSISYVVLFVNFCKYLSMSGVPLRWRDRVPEEHPMVMVGGQAYCNPEVMAPVVDCVFLGEAEDEPGNGGIGQVLHMIEMFKAEGSWGADRVACYERLARTFNFLYFPRLVDVRYDSEPYKRVTGYGSAVDGVRVPFLKRHVADLDKIAPLDDPPLLYADPSMGSGDIEASRGCPAWCSFCRLSFAQKPFRQRSVEYMTEFATKFRNNVGGVELSPFGPDFPMQTNKNALLKSLLENVSDKVDNVAQRIDDFISDDTYLLLQSAGGARSITLGLEGLSQRMRDLVGKATSDAEVCEAVSRGLRAGFRKFKLFMIVGLPGEDTGDVSRIMALARDLAAIRDSMSVDKVTIQFSFTPLLYEAQTPFQWFSSWPVPNHDLIDVAKELRELKIIFKIGVKAEPNKLMFFQLCQRASRDAGEAVVDVLEELDAGCWGGVPKDMASRLEAALKAHGFTNGYADLFGERDRDDMLGWEFISTGISRNLLWDTFERMRDFAQSTDSATYDAKFDERYHGNEWIDRCLAEGTQIRLADGRTVAIESLVDQEADVLAADMAGEPVNAHAHAVWETGDREDVVEVEFEDGSKVRLTADHKVMLADGAYMEAGLLTPEHEVATVAGPVPDKIRLPGWKEIDLDFWDNVVVGSPPERWGSATGVEFDGSPCLLWDGPLDENGYGQWRVRSLGLLSAFAYAWVSRHGPVPPEMVINHMCHVKRCVSHLELCTVSENTKLAWASLALCRTGRHENTPENRIAIGDTGKFRCEPCYRESLERYYEARAQRAGRVRLRNGAPTCRHDHEYTEENTRWVSRKGYTRLFRVCRQCERDSDERRRLRRQLSL